MKSLCTKGILYFSLALLVVGAAACTQSRPAVPTPTLVPLVNETPLSPNNGGNPTPIIIEQPTAGADATLVIPPVGETPVPAVGDATPTVDTGGGIVPTPDLLQPTLLPTPTTVGDTGQPQPTAEGGATNGQTGGACSSPYTVKAGEWFLLIARNCGVTAGELQAANPGVNPNLLRPGQVLNIPGGGSAGGGNQPPPAMTPSAGGNQPPPSNGGGSCSNPYVVQNGDTLYSIATRCGSTVLAIQQANGIPAPEYIFPGQQLTIP